MDHAIIKLRVTDFSRLDEQSHVYLDYTGAALYPISLVDAHHDFLASSILGNPHSSNPSSQCSTDVIEETCSAVLAFFNADPLKYNVVFTANASAAIKLVAESFPFRRGSAFLLSEDNHNSVLGIREYANRAHASVHYLPLSDDLRLSDRTVVDALNSIHYRPSTHPSLFAYPAQSNFSGVKHNLSYVKVANKAGWYTLLDAAAYVPSSPLNLSASGPMSVQPDFVALSFYKIFGFPTGMGALIARHDALAKLQRPWFAGGTVNFSSVSTGLHSLQRGSHGFEDGTPNFAAFAAVREGLRYMSRIGMARVSSHIETLTRQLLDGLSRVHWSDGATIVDNDERAADGERLVSSAAIRVYGPVELEQRGGTIAFDVLRNNDRVDAREVERSANEAGISLRVGCFCNPGAAEKALGIPAKRVRPCLKKLGSAFSIDHVSKCVGQGYLGCVRVSVGLANTSGDVETFLKFISGFCCSIVSSEVVRERKMKQIGYCPHKINTKHVSGTLSLGGLYKMAKLFCGAKENDGSA